MLLLAVPFGAAVPDALLALVRRQRQKAIRRSLSFFLDLMLSLLQAGMTIDEALMNFPMVRKACMWSERCMSVTGTPSFSSRRA